ncbi:shikimate dehydrogenase [Desulfobulbus alkaliphilus]|uniref:shikimate dehydrogenase n=1 Tax=Desulfobulbus alkaliphilus TaxID=869814 RepID=UPI001964BC9C|nr:shikimate dehydrogenase [Desulfobulbus alkaliphilus]MBM9536657.1 shikimate dehydrogenase [Desulfobulbus alkaliphilus]
MINGTTRLFGIIGNPVAHSLSPIMHNAAFKTLGLNAVYLPMQPKNLDEGYRGLRALGFVGVSVTVPFKVAIMPLLDQIDPVARKIGAVNTLLFHQDAHGSTLCTGSNTDWIGSNRALETEIDLSGSTVLILGAGGAARAIGFGLVEAGATILVHNRTETKGRKLAAQLGATSVPDQQLADIRADVLINTTSVGMSPNHQALPINPKLLSHFSVVMDIVYAPLETALLREAAACGCRTVDGLQMLLHQGTAQCSLWTGQEAPLAVMRQALLLELSSRGTAPAPGT